MAFYAATIRVAPGVEIPMMGMRINQADKKDAVKAVENAIRVGVRWFDFPAGYIHERAVAMTLHELMKHHAVVRSELFISKNVFIHDIKSNTVDPKLRRALTVLGLQYLDLLQIHTDALTDTPLNQNTVCANHQVWDQLHCFFKKKSVRAVGVVSWQEGCYDQYLDAETPIFAEEVMTQMISPQGGDWRFQLAPGLKHRCTSRKHLPPVIMPTAGCDIACPSPELFGQRMAYTIINEKKDNAAIGIMDICYNKVHKNRFDCKVKCPKHNSQEGSYVFSEMNVVLMCVLAFILLVSMSCFYL
ncbi:hypothetical protein CAEBREN_20796 [Caenorhabditis brenneri]|uniref:NADP-dependent oxidoreductase domain-containing protein n=1 Tax=Caenorhabditis brenneri TaxID=135651 RepID=G0N4Y5_CAEBE|nr:hypothetical protein CAEBREN_20796 [Caenorhabditis brenneri]